MEMNELDQRLSPRGWRIRPVATTVRARQSDWPEQVEVVMGDNADGTGMLALAINFRSMPLGGERFRDIFNADREEILRTFGSFTVRQLRHDSTWAPTIGHRAFMGGFGVAGVSRQAQVVMFDRCPAAQFGPDMYETFFAEAARFAEAGDQVAQVLQRVYQRTVLANQPHAIELPVEAGIGAPELATTVYPWRR